MDTRFTKHGEGQDVKAARPENKASQENLQAKTKVDMAPNKHEGAADEPSHSGHRFDG